MADIELKKGDLVSVPCIVEYGTGEWAGDIHSVFVKPVQGYSSGFSVSADQVNVLRRLFAVGEIVTHGGRFGEVMHVTKDQQWLLVMAENGDPVPTVWNAEDCDRLAEKPKPPVMLAVVPMADDPMRTGESLADLVEGAPV